MLSIPNITYFNFSSFIDVNTKEELPEPRCFS